MVNQKFQMKIVLLVILGWLLIPTGTPDDVITFFIIGILGIPLYIMVLIAVFYIIWYNGITPKKAKKHIGNFASYVGLK